MAKTVNNRRGAQADVLTLDYMFLETKGIVYENNGREQYLFWEADGKGHPHHEQVREVFDIPMDAIIATMLYAEVGDTIEVNMTVTAKDEHDFWKKVKRYCSKIMIDDESTEFFLAFRKHPFDMKAETFSFGYREAVRRGLIDNIVDNPPRVIPLKEIIEHLKDTDGTGDLDWIDQMVEKISKYKRWTFSHIDPAQINNYGEMDKTVQEYADAWSSSVPPVVLIPVIYKKRLLKYDIVDGGHRTAAAEIVGVPVPAYVPVWGAS